MAAPSGDRVACQSEKAAPYGAVGTPPSRRNRLARLVPLTVRRNIESSQRPCEALRARSERPHAEAANPYVRSPRSRTDWPGPMGSGSGIEMAESPDPTASGEPLLRHPRGQVRAVGQAAPNAQLCFVPPTPTRSATSEAGHLDCWVGGISRGSFPANALTTVLAHRGAY